MRAWSLIRAQPHYRHDAFLSGLRAAGYQVTDGAPSFPVRAGDVLVVWNRYYEHERIADRFEAGGGTVLCAENAYLRGRHDGGDYYALAIHGHNGIGRWHVGGPERWDALGVELAPWRAEGRHVLVAPNRSFGMRGYTMPNHWAQDAAERLRMRTSREIRVRPHPGNDAPKVPLADDLRDAHCVVIWSSSVGVKALIAGVPVICEAPAWICKAATSPTWEGLAQDWEARRIEALRALAWAQFTAEEIGSGEAFQSLLAA